MKHQVIGTNTTLVKSHVDSFNKSSKLTTKNKMILGDYYTYDLNETLIYLGDMNNNIVFKNKVGNTPNTTELIEKYSTGHSNNRFNDGSITLILTTHSVE